MTEPAVGLAPGPSDAELISLTALQVLPGSSAGTGVGSPASPGGAGLPSLPEPGG
jgi:hypothetical protein